MANQAERDALEERGERRCCLSSSLLMMKFWPGCKPIKNISAAATGASVLPDGDAYYAERLRYMTTLDLTAQEIHTLGIAEVARIQAEMEGIKRQVGFEGSLQAFFSFMREDDRFYYLNTDAGRTAYIEQAEAILSEVKAKLPDYFGLLPKAGLQVKRVEAFREVRVALRICSRYGRWFATGNVCASGRYAAAVNRWKTCPTMRGCLAIICKYRFSRNYRGCRCFARYGVTPLSVRAGAVRRIIGERDGGYQDPYADMGRLSGEIGAPSGWLSTPVFTALAGPRSEPLNMRCKTRRGRKPSALRSSPVFQQSGSGNRLQDRNVENSGIPIVGGGCSRDSFDIRFHDTVLGSGPLPMALLESKVERWIDASR